MLGVHRHAGFSSDISENDCLCSLDRYSLHSHRPGPGRKVEFSPEHWQFPFSLLLCLSGVGVPQPMEIGDNSVSLLAPSTCMRLPSFSAVFTSWVTSPALLLFCKNSRFRGCLASEVLGSHAQDHSSIPSTHKVAHSCLWLLFQEIQCPLWPPARLVHLQTDTHEHTNIPKRKTQKKSFYIFTLKIWGLFSTWVLFVFLWLLLGFLR